MLNPSQTDAKRQIESFLLSNNQMMCLVAPSGYGKSFLIDAIIADIESTRKKGKLLGSSMDIRNFCKTATTNKAASVLKDGQTVQSLLGLTLRTDFSNGKQFLATTGKSKSVTKSLVFIDEASMVGGELAQHFKLFDPKSTKIVFVGDDHQLLPVNEVKSLVFDSGLPVARLDQPMRQDPESDLFKLCEQLRETVRTGVFKPILEGEGIRHLTSKETVETLSEWFYDGMRADEARCVTYTNKKAIALNKFIRPICGFSEDWSVGDIVAVRNSCKDMHDSTRTSVEEIFTIRAIDPEIYTDVHSVEYREFTLDDGNIYRVATNQAMLASTLKQLAANNSWKDFYYLKENMLDMRSAYACTGHTVQGSTYDRVYIDLADMATCRNPDTLARLLYVAVSRAKIEVIFNGNLPAKFR